MTTQSQLLQDIIDTHQNVTSKAFNPMEQSGITVRKAMPTYCSTSMLASAFAPPKVSLVMTVYNNEATLSEVLESLLAQTFTNWELILWDDGSTDGSVAIAQTYAQQDNRIRFYQGDRLGLGPALIKAHTYTKGEYVGWVN
ncbi:MAG: glycosyltransferase family 2 protein, partial [Cyanobacteria bacterium P01_F01_bin.150]